MSYSIIINSIGLIIDMIGALIIFVCSPSNFISFDGGNMDGTPTKTELDKIRKERWLRRGLLTMVLGFIFQLASNFL